MRQPPFSELDGSQSTARSRWLKLSGHRGGICYPSPLVDAIPPVALAKFGGWLMIVLWGQNLCPTSTNSKCLFCGRFNGLQIKWFCRIDERTHAAWNAQSLLVDLMDAYYLKASKVFFKLGYRTICISLCNTLKNKRHQCLIYSITR